MRTRRLVLTPLLLAAALMVPTLTLAQHAPGGGAAGDLSGANAVAELTTFTLNHPNRYGDGAGMEATRDYLAGKLQAYGYEVERHRYNGGTNIIGILRGTDRPHDWVTVTAHYDTVSATTGALGLTIHGAWDNGAGVAAVLEIARVAAERPWANTLAVVFFDDEELGLVGSQAFVNAYDNKPWANGNIRLTANVNMDPPGLNWPCAFQGAYLPVTLFQHRQGAPGTGRDLLLQYAQTAVDLEGVPPEARELYFGGVSIGILSGASDNVAFGQRGIPDLYVGSSTHLVTPVAKLNPFFYPLHTPFDTLPTMYAYCPPTILEQGFEVEMRIVYAVLQGIDGHSGQFPRS